VDNVAPITASVTSPVDGTVFPTLTGPAAPYTGQAADNAGGVGLNANTAVTYTLVRDSDGAYWNGTNNFVAGLPINLTTASAVTSGNTPVTWNSNQTLPTWSTQQGGDYTVQATTTDKA